MPKPSTRIMASTSAMKLDVITVTAPAPWRGTPRRSCRRARRARAAAAGCCLVLCGVDERGNSSCAFSWLRRPRFAERAAGVADQADGDVAAGGAVVLPRDACQLSTAAHARTPFA